VPGVTNLWINPEAEYVVAEVDGRRMVLSRDGAYRLSFQTSVKIIREVKGGEFVGQEGAEPSLGGLGGDLRRPFRRP
jgi:leucyl-tRNA synthetase